MSNDFVIFHDKEKYDTDSDHRIYANIGYGDKLNNFLKSGLSFPCEHRLYEKRRKLKKF